MRFFPKIKTIKNTANSFGDDLKEKTKELIGTKEIVRNYEYGKEMFQHLIKVDNKKGDNLTPNDFNDVVKKNKWSVDDLSRMYRNYIVLFYVFFLGVIVCLFSMGLSFLNDSKFDTIIQFVTSLSFMFYFGISMVANGLRCYQLNNKKLISLNDYIKLGIKEMYPKSTKLKQI